MRGLRRSQMAGSFRHEVKHYRPIETSDGLGAGGVLSSSNGALVADSVRCSITPASSKEKELSDRRSMTVTHLLTMWYDPNRPVKAQDYFVLAGSAKRYEVVEILNPEMRNEVLIVKVKEYEANI